MVNWANLVSQVFNGLVLGALLALISSGLTIIYGTLGVLQPSPRRDVHARRLCRVRGVFLHAVVLLSRDRRRAVRDDRRLGDGATDHTDFYNRPREDQILVTFGLAICFVEVVRYVFGGLSKVVPPPSWAAGISSLGFMYYPTYRLIVVGIVAVALLSLYLMLYRTRLGMIARAGIEDSAMVDALGINVYRVFMVVFGVGAMAAGFAGIINAPVVSLTPDMGEAILVQTFVVVVIGGVGSFTGAVLGGLFAGEIISITSMVNPGYSCVMLFAVMTLVLLLRPQGLLGVHGRE